MNTAKNSDPPEVHSLTRSPDLSADFTIEKNCPGLAVHCSGEASSLLGAELAVGLLLISLFVAALLIPFERLMPQERNGKRSSPSTITDSQKKNSPGGIPDQFPTSPGLQNHEET